MADDETIPVRYRLFPTLFGIVLVVTGLPLVVGGTRLLSLGGSAYYIIIGFGLIVSGLLFAARRLSAVALYAALFVGTLVWAFWEVGFQFWPIVARVVAPAVYLVVALLLVPALTRDRRLKVAAWITAFIVMAALGGAAVSGLQPHGAMWGAGQRDLRADGAPTEWQAYGQSLAGNRYSASDEINQSNVSTLQVAWTFRTGTPTPVGADDSNTPIQIGDTLYYCSPFNRVYALDAETGHQRWMFDPKANGPLWQRCRGLASYTSVNPHDPCPIRILLTTIDARLLAIDARTGRRCDGFGMHGEVSLREGMGEVKPGYYFQTSTPTVANGIVVVGGFVLDNMSLHEPPGVVRGFDAQTGALKWAWDVGFPTPLTSPPPGGYTRGTPNVWTAVAADERLGLVYLPTGNATPDFWGGQRRTFDDNYSTSIVALDAKSGREAWRYQLVHHDLWDYDAASQPALYDFPGKDGRRIPALIQLTKQGQIFVLDRRTGKPLVDVEERPVPRGTALGERYSPTQPFSVGMPMIGTERLSESAMWGITPIDQMFCRIAYRESRYEGPFTPPGSPRALLWPGDFGGMNWGSAAIDRRRDYMMFTDIRVPQLIELIPRSLVRTMSEVSAHATFANMLGTPYAVEKPLFMSILGIPCSRPPYGTITAVDLRTRKIAWQAPIGTVRDTGPLGLKMHVPLDVGMPTVGGPISTGGGLTFYSGTQDYYLRALNTDTGRELWRQRLPVGTNSTPMTYISPRSGHQFVLVTAGGARDSPDRGDYIIAYKLPSDKR